MWEWLRSIFDTTGFPSRWNCGSGWEDTPWLGWLHIISDLGTFIAYTGIPLVLIYLIRKREDLPFPRVFWFFCLFIFSCGTVHLIEAVIFFEPLYRLSGIFKALTAIVSLATLTLMVPFARQALALPGQAQLAKQLQDEVEERRRSEHALQRSEARLAATQEIAGLGSFFFTPEAEAKISLYPMAQEILGEMDAAQFLEQRDTRTGRRLQSLLETAQETRSEMDAVLKLDDGRSLRLHFHVPTGELVEAGILLGTVQDITAELARLEQAHERERTALENQKLESLGAMAGGIAHEFNNVLMGVIGYNDMAAELCAEDPRLRELLDKARSAANHAAHLCGQMLAYSGKGRFINEHLELNSCIQEVRGLAEVAVGTRHEIRFDCSQDQLEVLGDPAQINQLLMNLVNNAAEALQDTSGTVRVETGTARLDAAAVAALQDDLDEHPPATEAFHYLRVHDDGEGMDEKTLARVTEPFFSTRFTGRGLGMATVRGIVRGHGGLLQIESEVGQGTVVTVYFPAQTAASLRDEPAPSPGAALSPEAGAVLVIDDDANARDVCESLLRRQGFEVRTTSGGQEGLDTYLARPEQFQAVILDLTMPGMSGTEVYSELRRRAPGARVLLVSGFSREEVSRRFAGEDPPRHFLAKPFGAVELMQALATLCSPTGSHP